MPYNQKTVGVRVNPMADVFLMVVLLVLIATTAGVVNNYIKRDGKQNKKLLERIEALEAAGGSELEERVRALEVIVIDEQHSLKDKISNL